MLTNYDNVVFDLGGVVFGIDRDRCVANLEALGLADAASMLDLYKQSGSFLALEEGRISAAEYFDELRAKCTDADVSDKRINEALDSFITTLPVSRLKALREIRSMGKKVFALSNTNPVMYPTVITRLFRGEGLEIDDYFDGQILSFREHVCKPDAAIYRRLLTRYGLDPSRTLFVDDSAANCAAAEAEGIAAVLLPAGAEFMDVLSLTD